MSVIKVRSDQIKYKAIQFLPGQKTASIKALKAAVKGKQLVRLQDPRMEGCQCSFDGHIRIIRAFNPTGHSDEQFIYRADVGYVDE